MNGFERYSMLKEHVLSQAITDGLTAESVGNNGRDDFFAVFLSVCDKTERARVFHGTGGSLSDAWADAANNMVAFSKEKPFKGAWIKADVVISYEEIPIKSLNKILVKDRYMNYTRLGISLDTRFKTAFLEAELNGNEIINYYKTEEPDLGAEPVSLSKINQYLKEYRGTEPIKSLPERITVFKTRGFFCGEDDVIHELYSDSADYGRRRVAVTDGAAVKSAVISACEYLADLIGADGKFTYGYLPAFDKELEGYNLARHTSALWGIINLYRMKSDDSLVLKLNSALEYIAGHIEYKDNNTFGLSENNYNAAGAAIIIFTEYMDVFMNEEYIDIVRKLANGLLNETQTLDSEAAYALVRAYSYIKDKRYLDSAKAAAERLVVGDFTESRDLWAAYLLFEITKYINDVRYYDFALRSADETLCAVYNLETSGQTDLETLIVLWRTYQRALKYNVPSLYIRSYDPEFFAQTIYFRARHMLNGFFYPETAMYMKAPEKIAGTFMLRHKGFRVRIDEIRHFISSYFFYSVYYNDIKQYISDEFIRQTDSSPTVNDIREAAEKARLEPRELPENFTVYHLNQSFGKEIGEVGQAVINRMRLFKNAGIKSKIITSAHNLNLHENMKKYGISEEEHENIYDYFQEARGVENKLLELEELFPCEIYKAREIVFENNSVGYKIYLSKKHVAYALFKNNRLSYINRFENNKKIKRCFYDCRGFLSLDKFLNDKEQTVTEAYYTPSGERVIEKYYEIINDKSKLCLIRLKSKGEWIQFLNETAMIAYYFDNILNEDNNFIIVDKNIVYNEALIIMNKKIKKAAVLHKKHIDGDETLTDNISKSYRELFNSPSEFNAIITLNEEQKREVTRRFNNILQMYAIPHKNNETDFDEQDALRKWKRLFNDFMK